MPGSAVGVEVLSGALGRTVAGVMPVGAVVRVRGVVCPTQKDLGKLMLNGNKGAEYGAFSSARHGSSAKIALQYERVIELVRMGMRGAVRH